MIIDYIYPSWLDNFRCLPLGCCCKHTRHIRFSLGDYNRLREALRGKPLEQVLAGGVKFPGAPGPAEGSGNTSVSTMIEGSDPGEPGVSCPTVTPSGLANLGPDTRGWAEFKMTGDGSCPFLRDSVTCQIHEIMGPEVLPSICRNFPFYACPSADGLEVSLTLVCPAARLALKNGPGPFVLVRRPNPPAGRVFEAGINGSSGKFRHIQLRPNQFIPWDEYRRLREIMLATVIYFRRPIINRLAALAATLTGVSTAIATGQRLDWPIAWLNCLIDFPDGADSSLCGPALPHTWSELRSRYDDHFFQAATVNPDDILNTWPAYLNFIESQPLPETDQIRQGLHAWPDSYLKYVLPSADETAPLLERCILVKLAVIGIDIGGSLARNLDRLTALLAIAMRLGAALAAARREPLSVDSLSLAIGLAELYLQENPQAVFSFPLTEPSKEIRINKD